LLIIYHLLGWRYLLVCLSLFVVIALIPLLFYKPEVHVEPQKRSEGASMKDIISFFRIPGMGRRIIILTLFYSGIIGSLAMIKPYLVDNGYNIRQIGVISGMAGTSLAALSAFFAGFFMKRITRRNAMLLFAAVMLFATLYLLVATSINSGFFIVSAILFIWISYGMATVGVYTTSMDTAREGRGGTDFTLQIVITHLSSLIIAVYSGRFADMFGYRSLFSVEIILAILSFTAVYFLFPVKQTEQ
jgi:predicted MFS family arabinose efflux permease